MIKQTMQGIDELSAVVLKVIEEEGKVTKEFVQEMAYWATQYPLEGDGALPVSFQKLFRRLEQFRHTEYEELPSIAKEAFLYGCLVAYASIIRQTAETRLLSKDFSIVAKQHEKIYPVFCSIKKWPGISHKKLAEQSGYSESSLSQIMAKAALQQFFFSQKLGRNKYYHLSPEGVELLQEMEKTKEEDVVIDELCDEQKIALGQEEIAGIQDEEDFAAAFVQYKPNREYDNNIPKVFQNGLRMEQELNQNEEFSVLLYSLSGKDCIEDLDLLKGKAYEN